MLSLYPASADSGVGYSFVLMLDRSKSESKKGLWVYPKALASRRSCWCGFIDNVFQVAVQLNAL